MRVRMTVGLSGPIYSLDPGDEREFPDDEAVRLIEAGYAVPVAGRPLERTVRARAAESRADADPPQPRPRRRSRRG